MKLDIKTRNGDFLEIINMDLINRKIELLKEKHKKNPTKGIQEKFESLFVSETFNSFFTEGHISSRRQIKKDFIKKDEVVFLQNSYSTFYDAYLFIIKGKEFSIANLFTLYSIISDKWISAKNKLEDGKMFRNGDVIIVGNKRLGKEYKGFAPKDINLALNNLFKFIQDDKYNIYLRAIIGHIYFEIIHPFYDFNGRVGRFLPLWIFSNEDRINEMIYFATAMGHFREQYLSIFKYIDINTYQMDLDKMIDKVLNLLIINQEQYVWIKSIENKFLDETKKSFSSIQKNLIWRLMIKSEISGYDDSWFKLNQNDKNFIELEMKPSNFTNALKPLKETKIIDVSKTSPSKYKLNNYKLFILDKN